MHDFATDITRRISPSNHSSSSTICLGDLYAISHYVNCDNFSLTHLVFLASTSQQNKPFIYIKELKDS